MAEMEQKASVYSEEIQTACRNQSRILFISSWKAWALKNLTEFMSQVHEYATNHLAPCQQPKPFPPPKPAPRSVYPQGDGA